MQMAKFEGELLHSHYTGFARQAGSKKRATIAREYQEMGLLVQMGGAMSIETPVTVTAGEIGSSQSFRNGTRRSQFGSAIDNYIT